MRISDWSSDVCSSDLAADVSTSAALQEPPMSRAPSLFISHGSPMFSIEPGELGPNLRQLGRTLADLSAIVVVSPPWQTQGVRVGATRSEERRVGKEGVS